MLDEDFNDSAPRRCAISLRKPSSLPLRRVAERYDGERTTVRAATTPIDLQFASRGKEVEFMPSYAKHRARLLDRYSDAEHVSPLPHRVSSALICSLWYRLLCRHRQPFLLGKVAAAVADSLRKPPSLERVRSPGIQHQGRGSVGRLVDPHMNRTAKPSLIKVDPTSTPLTRRRPRAGGQHHLEGPGAIANRLP